MPKSLLSILAAALCISAAAQDKIPSFGKIDKADLEMKDCSFDPGAEAVVLLDVGETIFKTIQMGYETRSEYHIRIKVLKSGGIKYANVSFRYYSKRRYDEVGDISAASYNLDASGNIVTTKLEKSQVYDKPITDNHSEISFAIPNVKEGTVFEYKYKKTRKTYSRIDPWYFQREIPVAFSQFRLQIPSGFDFNYQTIRRQEVEVKKGKNDFDGTKFIMENIPGLKDEPYAASKNNYIQRIEFVLKGLNMPGLPYYDIMGTWAKTIQNVLEDEDFGGQLKKNIKNTPELDASLAKIVTPKEKIKTIYEYVQSYMQWNEYVDIWSYSGVKKAWDKKSGSVADVNLILVNLLKDNGIQAKAVLAKSKDAGMVNVAYPDLEQFDRVLAMVMVGDETYIMNACDKYNPYNLIPHDVLYTQALVIDKENTGWIELGIDKKMKHMALFNIAIDKEGKLSGTADMSSQDYGSNVRNKFYKDGQLKEILENNPGVKIFIDTLTAVNTGDEANTLSQKITFKGEIENSGGYYFLPYNVFSGLFANPFVEDNRVMDIDFSFPRMYTVTGTYTIPEEFDIDALPQNTKMIMPDTSIVLSRVSQKVGNMVQFRLTVDFKGYGYLAEDYPFVKEFFRKMYEMLEERVVLKKKA